MNWFMRKASDWKYKRRLTAAEKLVKSSVEREALTALRDYLDVWPACDSKDLDCVRRRAQDARRVLESFNQTHSRVLVGVVSLQMSMAELCRDDLLRHPSAPVWVLTAQTGAVGLGTEIILRLVRP